MKKPTFTQAQSLAFWKNNRGMISRFVDEMMYSGNRRDRRLQAKEELALIERPGFLKSDKPFEFTKRGLRFI